MTPLPSAALRDYLSRIGVDGPLGQDLATLERLHCAHPGNIPFENLSPLLGEAVPLDIAALVQKLVMRGRGGYCYEHNLLFWAALASLGFRVTGLEARVRYGLPADRMMPRTHMLLKVELPEGPFIADVGFGLHTLTAPLRLDSGAEQSTPHGPCRIVAAGADRVLEVKSGRQWQPLYAFDLQAQAPADYAVANWYTSTHPASRFVTSLMLARTDPECRHAMLGATYSVHHLHGGVDRRALCSVGEIRRIMQDVFRLRLPDAPALDEKLGRLLKAGDG